MKELEIKPNPLNPLVLIYGLASLAISIVLGFSVLPQAISLYGEFPDDPVSRQLLLTIVLAMFVVWIFFAISVVHSLGKKISVEGSLIYFRKKSKFGFGNWEVDKIVDFSNVVMVGEKPKTGFVFTGKVLIPILYYLLVFEMKDGTNQELMLNGWDASGIKNLFYYLRGKFPDVKFKNKLLMDPPEKLSGLDKFI